MAMQVVCRAYAALKQGDGCESVAYCNTVLVASKRRRNGAKSRQGASACGIGCAAMTAGLICAVLVSSVEGMSRMLHKRVREVKGTGACTTVRRKSWMVRRRGKGDW
jgi:hypothetical protein